METPLPSLSSSKTFFKLNRSFCSVKLSPVDLPLSTGESTSGKQISATLETDSSSCAYAMFTMAANAEKTRSDRFISAILFYLKFN
jgi:hypothetical protein